jgi:hypothetical protein
MTQVLFFGAWQKMIYLKKPKAKNLVTFRNLPSGFHSGGMGLPPLAEEQNLVAANYSFYHLYC